MQDVRLPDLPSNLPSLPDFDAPATPRSEPLPKPYVKQVKQEPTPKKAETLGFITNLPKSLLKMAKEIFVDLPLAVGTAGYHYAKDPTQYGKDLDLFLNSPGDAGELLRKGVTDYYEDGFWANFNEDPARLLSDAATVMSGVGAVGKLGHAGKAGKAARIAQNVGKAAEYVDPLLLAGKGAKLAFGRGLRSIGYGELTGDIEQMAAHAAAREGLASAHASRAEMFDSLTPEQAEELRRLLILGDPSELDAAVTRGGPVAERLRKWQDRIAVTEEPYWKATQSLDDEAMIEANAKAIEMYTLEHPDKFPLPIMRDQAKDLIRQKALRPTYMSLYRLKNQADDLTLYDVVNNPAVRSGILGRLEKRLGKGEYLKDIDEIQKRQIHSFHQAKYKLDLLAEVK